MSLAGYRINKKDFFFIAFILILALSLRFEYMKEYSRTSIYPVLEYSDSYSYFLWAKDIASGELFGDKAFMKWPLYAYFLAFFLKLFKDNIAYVYLLQYLLGAVNCVLIYFIGKKIFNEKAGFIAALLCALCGIFVFYDSLLVYTGLSLFLNSLLFLFILNAKGRVDKKKLFWLGAFLGICAITQAGIIIFGFLAVFWLLAESKLNLKRTLTGLALFISGAAVVIGGVTLRNYLAEKDFVLIAGNVGFNFYSGNNPQATGVFYCPEDINMNQEDMFRDARIIANNRTGRILNTREVSDFWFKQSYDFIREKPFSFLKLLLRKIALVMSPGEFIHDIEYHLISGKIRILKLMFSDLRFILPPALLGIFLGIKKFKVTGLLYIALFSLSVSISLFFVTARYRIVIVPYLALFAGFAIISVLETLKERKFLKFCLFCAILVGSFFLLSFSTGKLLSANSKERYAPFDYHYTRAMYYKNNSDYKNSLKELSLAHEIQPSNQSAVLQAGVIYFFSNDLKSAEERFKETLEINPLAVDAYYNLGLIYNKKKRYHEARDMLKQAISLDPENAGAHFELGLACKSLGEADCARQEFGAAMKKINRWRTEEREVIQKELASLGK